MELYDNNRAYYYNKRDQDVFLATTDVLFVC